MPLSGAVGGGDLKIPSGSIWGIWCFEAKARRRVALLYDALDQAQKDIGIGSLRKPAALIKADHQPVLFVAKLEDVIGFAEGLAEVGQGYKIKGLLRQARRILEEVEQAI